MSERLQASQVYVPKVSCPEGPQTPDFSRQLPGTFLYPKIDLYSGLYHAVQPIKECRESGFPSYRRFTDDELQLIARLIETDLYQEQTQNLTRGALAIWTEEQITGSVEPSLAYGLKLRDAYDSKTKNPDEYFGALLANTRDHYDAYIKRHEGKKRHPEIARLQLRLAILSHRVEEAGAVDWFEQAVTTHEAIPGSTKTDTLSQNIDGVRLCLFAPEDLAQILCHGDPTHQASIDPHHNLHGIEYLADWVRLYFFFLPAKTPDQLQRGNHILKSTQRERLRDPVFKRSFDKFLGSSLYVKYIAFDDCFFFRPASDVAECWDEREEVWSRVNLHFPDFVVDVRERARKKILHDAARKYLGENADHPAVLWALDQSDFRTPLQRESKRRQHAAARQTAYTAGTNSIACDIGLVCDEPSNFDAVMHQMDDGDVAEFREVFQNARTSATQRAIAALSQCDVRTEMGYTVEPPCLTGEARKESAEQRRSLSDDLEKQYAGVRRKLFETMANEHGQWLALNDIGEGGTRALDHDQERLESLFPEAHAIIKRVRTRKSELLKQRDGLKSLIDASTTFRQQ